MSLPRYLAFVGLLCHASGLHACNNTQEAISSSLIGNHQCPTWFFWNETSDECQCGPDVGGVSCNQRKNQSSLRWLFCMTYDDKTGSTMQASSPFGDLQSTYHSPWVLLPENRLELTNAMCGKSNREGLLCSRCKPGYGPAVLSYKHECAQCSGGYLGWLLYFCVALVPTTIFFLVIVLCQVHTTSAPMNFFVYACQIISVSISVVPQQIVYHSEQMKLVSGVAVTAATSWNLDFFRLIIPPFCVSENLSNLQVLCMDYIIAFYPLLLTVVMYVCIQQHAKGCRLLVCLWVPFGYCWSPLLRKFNWSPVNSIVPIFATFLLLSNTKILFVSLSLLQIGSFTNMSSFGMIVQRDNTLYYDPTLTFFGQTHIPYAVLAVLVLVVFIVFPAVLLTLYPTQLFQKFLNFCGLSCHALHAFADAFNGCYKNGTDGTRDYRCFAGVYLFIRVASLYIVTFTSKTSLQISVMKFLSISCLFIFALATPYKSRLFNMLDSFGLMLLAFRLCVSEYRGSFNTIGVVYFSLYFVALLCCKIILTMNCHCSKKLKALLDHMSGVNELPPILY